MKRNRFADELRDAVLNGSCDEAKGRALNILFDLAEGIRNVDLTPVQVNDILAFREHYFAEKRTRKPMNRLAIDDKFPLVWKQR